MPRRREVPERVIAPDSKYGSPLVAKFLHCIMRDGKKSTAENILYDALDIADITELPADLVLNVLFYHVTEGRRGANSVVPKNNMRTIETLLGESFSVNTMGEITAIGNTANIAAADISASNGIIHVIDTVILPIN